MRKMGERRTRDQAAWRRKEWGDVWGHRGGLRPNRGGSGATHPPPQDATTTATASYLKGGGGLGPVLSEDSVEGDRVPEVHNVQRYL